MLCVFGCPRLAHYEKEFYPPPVLLVVSGSGGRPYCRLAREAVLVMGLLRHSVQVVAVGAGECGVEGGVLVQPGLSQVPHCVRPWASKDPRGACQLDSNTY